MKRTKKQLLKREKTTRDMAKFCNRIERMFKDCGRPIEFLDCVSTDQCQSKTPTIKPSRHLR